MQSKEPDTNSTRRIRAGIFGASGYTGQELLRLLVQHPQVEVAALSTRSYAGKSIAEIFPSFAGVSNLVCQNHDIKDLSQDLDLIFLALPHGEAAALVTETVLQNSCVIDLGADFRLKDPEQYHLWYHLEHANPSLIERAVYGLAELRKKEIGSARLLANPGCYATCSILALSPLLKSQLVEPDSIIIDAKSGVSGAGRGLSMGTHFSEVNENFKAYAVTSHRHTPEIEQLLSQEAKESVVLSFTPHLVPMQRGILVTAYAKLKAGATANAIERAYEEAYSNCPFIRLYEQNIEILPETRWVKGSNFCDIAFRVDKRSGRVIVIAALDNLIKGAAGQAVQNMNLIFGFDESAGLQGARQALFP